MLEIERKRSINKYSVNPNIILLITVIIFVQMGEASKYWTSGMVWLHHDLNHEACATDVLDMQCHILKDRTENTLPVITQYNEI